MRKNISIPLFALAVALYGGSFFLPTLHPFANHGKPFTGWDAFLSCFPPNLEGAEASLGLVALIAAWHANLAVLVGMVLWVAGRWRGARMSAAVALVLGVFVLPDFWTFLIDYPGYWVWVGSFAALLGACWLRIPREQAGNAPAICGQAAEQVSPSAGACR